MRKPLPITSFLVSGALLSTLGSTAQDFAPLTSGTRKLFAMASGPSLGYDLALDTAQVSGDTAVYNNYYLPNWQEEIPCSPECLPLNIPSWLGGPVVAVGPQSWTFHNRSGNPIHFEFGTTYEDTTLMFADSEQQFHMVYDGVGQGAVLEATDSIRHWTIIHRDLDGQPLASALNGTHISIGRTLGLVEFLQVDSFPTVLRPLVLAGQALPPLGLHTVTTADMDDHQPGDEFHWYQSGSNQMGTYELWTSKKYLDREELVDSVKYTCEINRWYYPGDPPSTEIRTEKFSRLVVLGDIPFERFDGHARSIHRADYCGMDLWTFSIIWDAFLVYWEPCDCWIESGISGMDEGWTERVIGIGTFESDHASNGLGASTSTVQTLYFKKDGIECGTPVLTGVEDPASTAGGVIAFPNPSNGSFTVRSTVRTGTWRLVGLFGAEVASGSVPSNEWHLDMPSLAPGAYALSVQNAEGHKLVTRIMITTGEAAR